jgi:hypothetical protein
VKYRTIEIRKPVSFGKFTLQDKYPLLIHFVDKDAVLICRNGVGVLITPKHFCTANIEETTELKSKEDETVEPINEMNSSPSVIVACINWFAVEEYYWVIARLERMRPDPVITEIITEARKVKFYAPSFKFEVNALQLFLALTSTTLNKTLLLSSKRQYRNH